MSNPKEKAEELVEKFMSYSYFSDGNNSMNRQYQQEDNAKQCALIAVDEIMNSIDAEDHFILYNYWQKVKKEIELL